MTLDEITRQAIFAVVLLVLLVRTPAMVRNQEQRPLWLVLAVFAGGSIVIQSWFGAAVNDLSGDAQFNNLVQGLWGILNMAVTLEFVMRLTSPGRHRRHRNTRISWAAGTALGMTALFELAPPDERFDPAFEFAPFTAYSLLAASYMIVSAVIMTVAMGRHLPSVGTRTLFAGLLMLTAGNATQVPFMAIRTLQRLATDVPPALGDAAFVLNTIRFVLVPLGCVVAALEPVRATVVHWHRHVRIYPLWRLLRDATPELALEPPISRAGDLFATGYLWERLHRRVVEIRDSIVYLHDTWASPALLDQVSRYAESEAPHGRRRVLATACLLAALRRFSLDGTPKRYLKPDRSLLPELLHDVATSRVEVEGLIRLQHVMRSREVRNFIDDTVEENAPARS